MSIFQMELSAPHPMRLLSSALITKINPPPKNGDDLDPRPLISLEVK